MPPFVHICSAVIWGSEAEGSTHMLFSAVMAAGATGMFLRVLKYGRFAAAVSGAWPAALAVARHWYWRLDMPSPGGSTQSLVRYLGWADAPASASVAVVLIPFGVVGWMWRFESGDEE
jgi:hypothetical protein